MSADYVCLFLWVLFTHHGSTVLIGLCRCASSKGPYHPHQQTQLHPSHCKKRGKALHIINRMFNIWRILVYNSAAFSKSAQIQGNRNAAHRCLSSAASLRATMCGSIRKLWRRSRYIGSQSWAPSSAVLRLKREVDFPSHNRFLKRHSTLALWLMWRQLINSSQVHLKGDDLPH